MNSINTLLDGIVDLNIELSQEQQNQFIKYKRLLKEWNEKINITAITDDIEIDVKHFLDSLTPVVTKLFDGKKSIIDIGTGGGFPGLPLKIFNEELKVTLLDSLNKRIIFLNEVIKDLGLKNIEAIHGRAEELGRTENYREQYDICISRAVASLNTLSEYCMPFVKVGGYFISMKGEDVEEELKEAEKGIKILGGSILKKELVKIPKSDIVHSLIIIEKIKETPTKYPRGGGKPKKTPL
ncbi:16S rRNA (guanine(527)-N(7))-methyltransferase RsmG [Tissierella sp. MB52-C2]|uniref:16S rRNA (guanine(527)-N(7))-methyltransferase RsmG n=1 Tax=Tissierella sp. MB52-C2 TaxID=3070999 RepID=UPI00280A8D07|nr:16S rRNA (guanine(527)-N(7))-methyltransferase RsmG [Tissierella sp. MB52-C2]WMM24728.1 16S rRNA (guanine(527)-N(7))-methyltransferase RsmG [Tissierella sp. MB52-C2]